MNHNKVTLVTLKVYQGDVNHPDFLDSGCLCCDPQGRLVAWAQVSGAGGFFPSTSYWDDGSEIWLSHQLTES